MTCKYCKKSIEDDSVFCRFCGERVQRSKRKPKEEVRVPPPAVTKSGRYRGRVMVDGSRVWITEDTEAAYYIRALAVKSGMIAEAAARPRDTLEKLITKYIDDHEAVLSPSTVGAYRSMCRTRFSGYMDSSVRGIEWQKMVSDETAKVCAKTVKNAWRLVTAALRYANIPPPNVSLLAVTRKETPFLDFEQIRIFVAAIRNTDYEAAYLLALHSLRLSEIYAITPDRCAGNVISVRGAVVAGKGGRVYKDLNKTDLSRRDIPVMIPRLSELVDALPVTANDTTLNKHLRRICEKAALPQVTMHGLRHSFASLAYHLKWSERMTMQTGGWSTPDVVHGIYTHLAARDVSDDIDRMREFYTEK